MMRWEQWERAGCWWFPVADKLFITCVSAEQHAGVALSALIRALCELEMVAIVRYAYDRRSNPQVGVAFPCIKQHYEVWPFTCVLRETRQTEPYKYVSLILDSVWCISSCLLWKTSDIFHFLYLKISRRWPPQVLLACFCLSFYRPFSRLWIVAPGTAWLAQHCSYLLSVRLFASVWSL